MVKTTRHLFKSHVSRANVRGWAWRAVALQKHKKIKENNFLKQPKGPFTNYVSTICSFLTN